MMAITFQDNPACTTPPLKALADPFGRRMTYLRLAVTDRCNFRCVYCMPFEDAEYLSPCDLLTFKEMKRLVRLFAGMGVTKLRLTGGEPFVRKGFPEFLALLCNDGELENIFITTNGALAAPHIPRLKTLGISGVNLSLDTLKPERFFRISGRKAFGAVRRTFIKLIEHEIPLKINMVVRKGLNADEILPVSRLAETYPVQVRFIEQMPFDGGGRTRPDTFSAERIVEVLREAYPSMTGVDRMNSTAMVYRIPGFKGTLGVIAGNSRLFCSSCNRLRITPNGMLKTCLYDNGALDLKQLLRHGADDTEIQDAVRACLKHRARDGFVAEALALKSGSESMSLIGG